jgi:hypothetical protein
MPSNVDERIDALTRNLELLARLHEEHERRLSKQEQHWNRFQRAMSAALQEYFDEGGDNGDQS